MGTLKKIIIVDDHPLFLEIMEDMVKEYLDSIGSGHDGYAIYKCRNGKEALETYRKEKPVYCIFSDYRMPDMTGDVVMREIQKDDPGVKKYVVSDYASIPEYKEAVSRHGARMVDKQDSVEIRSAMEECMG